VFQATQGKGLYWQNTLLPLVTIQKHTVLLRQSMVDNTTALKQKSISRQLYALLKACHTLNLFHRNVSQKETWNVKKMEKNAFVYCSTHCFCNSLSTHDLVMGSDSMHSARSHDKVIVMVTTMTTANL